MVFSPSHPSSLFCISPGVLEGTAAVKVSKEGGQPLPSLASGQAAPRVTKVLSRTPQGINGSMPSITGYAGAPGKSIQIRLCVKTIKENQGYLKESVNLFLTGYPGIPAAAISPDSVSGIHHFIVAEQFWGITK